MKKMILLIATCATIYHSADAQQEAKKSLLFEQIVTEELQLNGTGATVLVSSGGKIIYKKAVGTSNIELDVPMSVENIFRIGSITKQFTAIAILQLMEQGKLSLQDVITKFLPDYPVQGSEITIEHLLTHTSGIPDFAAIKDSLQRGRMDFTPTEMISFFKDQPLRFVPGAKYDYSNSNYFLLGYIIEKVSGKTYRQYLEEHFFTPLGMKSSHYDSDSKIIRARASGYTKNGKALENAAPISMTQPYAAGAIVSNAEDLFKWNKALQSYQLIKKETLAKALSRYKLNDGKESNYGYGFRFGFIRERPSVWHGGLINGFITMAMYLPKEDVYVVVLSNCDCFSPERVTARLAAAAIGNPFPSTEISVPDSLLQSYAGIYKNENGDQLEVSFANRKLYLQRGRGPRVIMKAYEKDKFFFEDQLITIEFSFGKNNITDRLTIHTRNGNEAWKKADKAALSTTEIKVSEQILASYIGEYEVTPQFTFVITKEKDRLFVQATDQDKLEMFAESDTKFFLKVNDATFEFVEDSGKVTKVKLKQGGRTADAKKIK